MRTFSGQNQLALTQDLTSPDGALQACRDLAIRVVSLTEIATGTKAAAVASLTRRYRFGSWLVKLTKGHKVTVHLHLYERLVRAVDEAALEVERSVARDRAQMAARRGRHAVAEGIGPAAPGDLPMDRAPSWWVPRLRERLRRWRVYRS